MQIRLIRSATMQVHYAGQKFITDPYLANKLSLPSYRSVSKNPVVDLPIPAEEVIAGFDTVIVSHRHSDHFDSTAKKLLPKEITLFCQPDDQAATQAEGFQNVIAIEDFILWQGIKITRVPGQHGSGEVLGDMGTVSGFVFENENEPTVYWMGDTIWCEETADAIRCFKPDIIITHSSGAVWGDHTLIVMDAAQTVEVCKAAPNCTVVAVHMESLDHATTSRHDLREYADRHGIPPERLLIPLDGDLLNLS
jgi:L-ascorbate metabolism protein UlaG (beta-lactamase superfamily)